MSCDEDMLNVALEALRLWVAHPELLLRILKIKVGQCAFSFSLGGELVHFSYDRDTS